MATLYRPSPWVEACNFYKWAQGETLKKPSVAGLTYIAPTNAENGEARIDLPGDIAWYNKRFLGFVAEIDPGKSLNTKTPYMLTVVGKVIFYEDDQDEPS